MKKLFTLACGVLMAMSASAADFGFCDKDGKFFDNGAVVSVGYEVQEYVPGILTIYEMESGVFYQGELGESYTVDARLSEEAKDSWNYVQCCAFGTCTMMSTGTFTKSGNATGTPEDLLLHYSAQNVVPTQDVVVKLSIFPTDSPSDKKEMTVNFIAKPAEEVVTGVANVVADQNAPVQYFNILGVEVKNPQKGQLLIRRQGKVAQKIIF